MISLDDKIKSLPGNPGVYQFFDAEGTIIYVGKAKNLKNRVSSYFNKITYENGKTRVLVRKITNVEIIIVETEFDALLLENNLIKKHKPRYNVLLKDDKTFPWLCIKNEPFPRIFATRNKINDGSHYFGPYASVKMMNTLMKLIRQLYTIRTCKLNLTKENIEKNKFKVCLEYHIGNCKGPCEAHQSENDYKDSIAEIKEIVKGNISSVLNHLKRLMIEYSEALAFEKAQKMKLKIDILENYKSKSTIVSPTIHNVDVISICSDNKYGFLNYMKVIDGAVVHSHTMEIKKRLEESDMELLELGIAEMKQSYNSFSSEIIVPFLPETKFEGINFIVPQIGDKKKLLEFSEKNAKYVMIDAHKQEKFTDPEQHAKRILETMQKDLRLSELPIHIECFDNSNIQGTNPVAACVVFKNAKPSKSDYRHFNIKTVVGPNDFASMEEVIYRRYKRMLDEKISLPQLVVIDGGKGQLASALKSIETLGLSGKMAVIGIAKRLEEIYYPGDNLPMYIDKKSETLTIIQQMRNEAHRFGITHHRNKRSKAAISTELTEIKGIGNETAETLLAHFRSIKNLKNAESREVENVIGKSKAKIIEAYFTNKKLT
jgi:excinuclease ABC subunit C